MNLSNYNIDRRLGNKFIQFKQPALATLETLLNTNLSNTATINKYLGQLIYLRDNWSNANRDIFINNTAGGYWDWEILEDNNVTGNWFTLFAYEDLECNINADTEQAHIRDTYSPEQPEVIFTIDGNYRYLKSMERCLTHTILPYDKCYKKKLHQKTSKPIKIQYKYGLF